MGINLNKGQTVNLAKPDGGSLTQVRMGLGWDAITVTKKSFFGGTKDVQKDIDLDASALLCNGKQVVEIVYFGHLTSNDRSLVHTGDNRTGAGDGDDESIMVNLPAVSPNIDGIYLVVNSYGGESFAEIENAFVRVVDSTQGDKEIVRYELSGTGAHTAMLMAKLSRSGGGWSFTAIGQPGRGRVAAEMATMVQSSAI